MSFLLFQLKNQRTSGSIRTFCNQKLQEDSQVSIRRWIRRINTGDNQGRALCRSKWDKSKPHRDLLKNPKIKYLVEILKLAGYLTNCLCKSVMNIQTANLVHLYTKAWHFTDGLFLKVIFWDLNFDISVISKLVTSILTFSVLVQAQEKRIGIKPSAVETVVARWCLRSKV